MTLRYKLLSAVSAIGLAMAVGGAQAAELLADQQLDNVVAGAAAAAAATGTNAATAQAAATVGLGGASLGGGTVGAGTFFYAAATGN